MKSMHIRKGDTVQILKGKDADKRGKVLKVDPVSCRVVIEGINRARKHMRPSQANPQGGVVDWELPVNASNVMLVCAGCDAPSRVKRLRSGGKSIIRSCKKCGREF
ncbi:MAG: 50S ribosomal protein L24 [Candidatus Anoxymicrobium japonicum]|uniref:Large ribosomal subunit protein uL24 n=1 Tax=Candidatus Anoxymicrobium japonicum TaxID=2013648 RepID=A0A2N3G5X9_9ACTN|nr:ribosomal protein L24 [uncultured bacterium]PKQ28120.1 MAG: 50S ribosomal protein L24 [Candidatus Anoxymicrobium japonicum]